VILFKLGDQILCHKQPKDAEHLSSAAGPRDRKLCETRNGGPVGCNDSFDPTPVNVAENASAMPFQGALPCRVPVGYP
jgi:hypothetical protein